MLPELFWTREERWAKQGGLGFKMKCEPLTPGRFEGSKGRWLKAFHPEFRVEFCCCCCFFFLDVLMIENELHFDISIKIEVHIYIYDYNYGEALTKA